MIWHGIATFVFVVVCVLLIFIILLQKGKGGTGLFGSMASTQIKIFGGSGGQDLFQRATWIMGAFVMILSLLLAVFNTGNISYSRYAETVPVQVAQVPSEQPRS